MYALGDVEESNIFRGDYDPFGGNAQSIAEGNHGMQDFRDAAAVSGAVDVKYADSFKLGCRIQQMIGCFCFQQADVRVGVYLRVLDNF